MSLRAVLCVLGAAACCASGEAQSQTRRGAAAAAPSLSILVDGQPIGDIDVRGEAGTLLIPKDALVDILTPAFGSDRAAMKQLSQLKDRNGQITVAALRDAGFAAVVDGNRLVIRRATPPPVATRVAAAPETAKVDRASVAGDDLRGKSLSLPVVVNSLRLGDVWIRYDRGNSPLIAKAALIDILTPLFGGDATTMGQLEAMPEKDGSVTLARVQQAGFSVRLDARRLELQRAAGTPAVAAAPSVPTQQSPRRERALNVVVPLKGGGTLLGEVPMQVLSDHSVQIPKAALIDILTPYLEDDDAALSRLQNVPDVDGQVTTEALKAAGFDVLFDRKMVEINNVGSVEGKPPKSEMPRVNSTGKSIAISVPVKDGDLELGDITVQIAPDSTVRVPKPALSQLLAGVFNKAEMAKLESVPNIDGKVALGDLAAAQLDIRYDPGLQEIVVRPGNGQRLANDLSVASRIKSGADVAKPASFSGYVNVTGGADYLLEGQKGPSMYLDLQSAVRMGGIVVENAGTYVGEIDPNVCPAYAQCTYSHQAGFKRQSSRIVYDSPEQQTRLQLGDFNMPGTAIQGTNDITGVSFQKTARIFAPGESIRPSGNGSFSLDRPADVDVQVNGVTVQHLRLRPGSYNFRDLPLTSGSNDVLLVITDDAGVRRSIPFTMFSGDNMIAAGKSEWAVNGGLASFYRDGERSYEAGHLLANAFYRYGLTDTLTLDAQAKGDQYATMGGMGFVTATAIGTWGLQGALSNSSAGIGLAANVNWDLINFRGVIGSFSDARETVRVAAEYRDPFFRSPGESIINASGVLYPQYPYWLRLTGAYTVPIAGYATATLAGRYKFADESKALSLTPNAVGGARFGADVTLAAPLTSWASGSVSAGYSNETYLRHMSGDQSDAPDMRIMLTLNVHPNEKTRLATTYDSLTRTESASAHAISQNGLDRWETDLNLIQNSDQQNANATGSIGYYGNRGEMRLSQSSGFASPSIEKYQLNPGDQRTSVRVASALAFADGHFAVGQPIRGNGFAIVYPHESIADKELAIGEGAGVRARSGPLGPALVPDLPAYSGTSLPIDATGLPLGYSLGTGAFEVAAPYRGGYALQVGSDSSVSAFGTLLLSDSTPLALATGVAFPADNPSKQVVVFTNRSGRFGAEGLAPGRWIIEVKHDNRPVRYELNVPKSSDGLLRAGVLYPKSGA